MRWKNHSPRMGHYNLQVQKGVVRFLIMLLVQESGLRKVRLTKHIFRLFVGVAYSSIVFPKHSGIDEKVLWDM